MRTTFKQTVPKGFTLIELIAAMSIFAVILVLSLQITNSATNSVRISESRAANDAAARSVFDQIASDVAKMIVRKDARVEFEKVSGNGNDDFAFLTTARGLTAAGNPGDRPLSLVSYRIRRDPDFGEQLLRGSRGHNFSDVGANAPVFNPAQPFPAIDPDNILPISNNILRMEIEFLAEAAGTIEKQILPPALEDLRGIVITLVTMDDRTRQGIPLAQLDNVAGEFPDATGLNDTLEVWTESRDSLTQQSFPSIPSELIKNLSCYQRTFLLP